MKNTFSFVFQNRVAIIWQLSGFIYIEACSIFFFNWKLIVWTLKKTFKRTSSYYKNLNKYNLIAVLILKLDILNKNDTYRKCIS